MVERSVVIKNPTGLHLHPAGVLCKEAMAFKSSISFRFGNTTSNAKSILSVLGSGVRCNDEITFVCSGPDEEEALARMVRIVEEGLGE